MDFRTILKHQPLLAILRNVPLETTLYYAGAIVAGGGSFFEVALNSPHALEQIAMLREAFGDRATIGAGTAITVDRAKAAVDAGAQFLLAPSTDPDVLAWCRDNGVAIMPGALTPSDVSVCLRYGFDVIKLFPAGDMPRGYIKSLKGPFETTDYVAIGGVKLENAADFMAQGYLGIGISGTLMPKEALQAGDWDACSAHVAAILSACKGR